MRDAGAGSKSLRGARAHGAVHAPASPRTGGRGGWRVGWRVAGGLLTLCGLGALAYGLWPIVGLLGQLGDGLGGSMDPAVQQRMDGATSALAGRVAWDVAGLVLLMAGPVLWRIGRAQPAPPASPALDELVEQKVAERLEALGYATGAAGMKGIEGLRASGQAEDDAADARASSPHASGASPGTSPPSWPPSSARGPRPGVAGGAPGQAVPAPSAARPAFVVRACRHCGRQLPLGISLCPGCGHEQ